MVRIRRQPPIFRLYVASFLVDTVSCSYSLVLSAHAREAFGATPGELGLLGTAATGVYAVGCLFVGGWSDRKGSLPFLNTGLSLLGFLVLPGVLLARSLLPLYFLNGAFGLCLALFWPPLLRELSLLSPGKTLWRSLGLFNIFWAAGTSVGSFSGPATYKELGFSGSIGISIALILLSLTLTLFQKSSESSKTPEENGPATIEKVEERRAKLFLYLAWIANFCVSFVLGGLQYVFLYVAEKLGFGLAWGGTILCGKDLGRLAAFACFCFFAGWHYSLPWLILLQLAGAAALILSGFATAPWAFLALFPFLGIYSGLAYYSSIYYGLNLRSSEGKKSGAHEGVLALGLCLGPVLCGQVGERVPDWPGGVLVFAGLVILAGLFLELVLVRAQKRS